MATDLPYPLPNPHPCRCNKGAALVYGSAQEGESKRSAFQKGATGLVILVGGFVLLTALLPPEKEQKTVFLPPTPRKSRLP